MRITTFSNKVKTLFSIICLIVCATTSYAQTTPTFAGTQGPTLLSGTDLNQGARYLYTNVALNVNGSPINADAVVTIITLNNINVNSVDTALGVDNRFEPETTTTAAGGFVEWEILFIESGTATATSDGAPILIDSYTLEAIDVDGNEFFEVLVPDSYTVEQGLTPPLGTCPQGSGAADNSIGCPSDLVVSTNGAFTRFQSDSDFSAGINEDRTEFIVSVTYNNISRVRFRNGRSTSGGTRQNSVSFLGEVNFITPNTVTVNSPPVVVDNNGNTVLQNSTGNTPINVLTGSSDPDGNLDPTTVILIDPNDSSNTGAVGSPLVIPGIGTYTVDNLGNVTYTPAADYTGDADINFRVEDTAAASSNIATLDITVLPDAGGDGIVDSVDLDDDEDGIPDLDEYIGPNDPFGDEDGDGILNFEDVVDDGAGDGSTTDYTDVNGDGTPDVYDTDNDGVPNHLDLDADNDGIFDAEEAGHGASQTNGVVDGPSGTDGIPDAVQDVGQENSGTINYTIADSESTPDGTPDFLELDSDGDGCNDVFEAGFTDDNRDGVLGDTPVSVDSNGVVTSGVDGYTGTNTTVTDFGTSSGCINAVDDTNDNVVNETTGGIAVVDILANDTVLGSAATLTPANVLLTVVTPASDPGIVLNTANGEVTVAPGTPAGMYSITYQICDAAAPAVCDTAIINIVVAPDSDGDGIDDLADLDADNDGIVDNEELGCTPGSVLDWDTAPFTGDPLADPVTTATTVIDGVTLTATNAGSSAGITNYFAGFTTFNGTSGLQLQARINEISNGNIIRYSVSFSTAVTNLSFSIVDIDRRTGADPFTDQVTVTALNGGANVPLNFNLGPAVNNLGGGVFQGNALVPVSITTDGDVQFSFLSPVDTIVLEFTNVGPDDTSTAATAILLSNMSWDCAAIDTDNDGVPNHLDLDADNDGIFDAEEAGHGASQTNGVVDGPSGTDGIPDAVQDVGQENSGTINYTIADSESTPDGTPDFLELDSDGDGCNDVFEAGFTDDNRDGVLGDTPVSVDSNGVVTSGVDGYTGTNTTVTDFGTSSGCINAVDDTNDNVVNETTGGIAVVDILANDTVLGSAATLTPANVLLTVVTPASDPGIVLNTANGEVTVAPGTPAGMYSITYQICDAAAPAVCDTAIINIVVAPDSDGDGIDDLADLDADNDGIVDNEELGCTPGSVLDWDTAPFTGDPLADPVTTATTVIDGVTLTATNAGSSAGITNYFAGFTTFNGTSGLQLQARINEISNGNIIRYSVSFSTAVTNLSFSIVDIDRRTGADPFTDQVTVTALNGGANVPLNFNLGPAVNNLGGGVFQGNALVPVSITTDGDVQFSFLSPVDTIVLEFTNVGPDDTSTAATAILLSNMSWDCAAIDTDNDGVPNHLDLDADNDGIYDVVESGAGLTDADNDGQVDGPTGGNGIPDAAEDGGVDGAGVSFSPVNTDSNTNDGSDYLDIDADDDGIPDNVEGQPTIGYILPSGDDNDADGVDDAYDPVCSLPDRSNPANDNTDECTAAGFTAGTAIDPEDTDTDTTPDYRDTDSDNDGFSDTDEGGFTNNGSLADTDGDGLLDTFEGGDNNDGFDVNDEINDPANDLPNDDVPSTPEVDYREAFTDNDNDGISDGVDLDDDNDGILDIVESGGNNPDGDEDGDSIPNYLDTIDDGNLGDGSTTDYTDSNGDGIPDVYDFDGDGIPNHLDLDSDNDGVYDVIESGAGLTDADNDGQVDGPVGTNGVPDAAEDGGADGAGVSFSPVNSFTNGAANDGPDYLDIDADDDGIVDNIEAQTTTGYIAPSGNDNDNDGIDDAYDPVCNLADESSPANGNTDECAAAGFTAGTVIIPVNTDATAATGSDTIPDYLDTDSDADGESDTIEAYDTDDDGIADTVPANADADNDGLDDNFDLVDLTTDTTPFVANPTNGGQTANNPFPDTDSPGGEPNWRENIFPNFTLTKVDTLNDGGDGQVDAGDTITYVFTITNTGNVTITNITVTDSNPAVVVTGGPLVSLAPGASDNTTFTGSYTITQADIDAGSFSNTATVNGDDPNGNGLSSLSDDPDDPADATDDDGDGNPDDPTVTVLTQAPNIILLKQDTSINDGGDGQVDAGDTINYTFTVTNNGNVTLSNITVTDSNPAVVVTGGPLLSLAPGASDNTTFTGSYTITQADIDAGSFTNTATVNGEDPSGGSVSSLSDDPDDPADTTDDDGDGNPDDPTVTVLTQAPNIILLKQDTSINDGGDGQVDVGDTINYTFTVTNNGNVTLSNITVTDSNPAVVVTGGPLLSLAPGASDNTTFTGSYTITQADIDAGSFSNTATVNGEDPNGGSVSSLSDDPDDPADATDDDGDGNPDDPTVTTIPQVETISLLKAADSPGFSNVGEVVTYTLTVINTGNVTLNNIVVTDALATITGGTPITTLAPGASSVVTAEYTITQANFNAGSFTNIAQVTADGPNGPVQDDSDDPNNPDDVDNNGDGEPDDPTVILLDSDDDGIPDDIDIDDDNDGIIDVLEGNGDSDGDGVIDSLDIDADGDGIPDNIEAQTTDGYIPPSGNDSDGDGLDDAYDNATSDGLDPVNTDGTDLPDYLDDDSDNDGFGDAIEGHDNDNDGIPDATPIGIDSDGDGLDDGYEGADANDGLDVNDDINDPANDLPDTDGTEDVNYRDTDDDGDGVDTIFEDDPDGDGNGPDDTDGDGTPDYLDDDDDGDGIPTEDEHPDPNGDGNPEDAIDTDGDGVPDYLDPNNPIEGDIEVFQLVTPNGDGTNDSLIIGNISKFPNNTVRLYNRLGVLVFETRGYNNTTNAFTGRSNGRITVSEDELLPVGTYYYVVDYVVPDTGETRSVSGFFYINR